tara:strand:- start:335 stop:580 length:246 start_codon:yes stop_codon:yes gene_type:complete
VAEAVVGPAVVGEACTALGLAAMPGARTRIPRVISVSESGLAKSSSSASLIPPRLGGWEGSNRRRVVELRMPSLSTLARYM